MTRSVLGGLALSYQLLWNPRRRLAGVQLFMQAQDSQAVDAAHIVDALDSFNFRPSLPLLLSVQSIPLLADLLARMPSEGCWLVVSDLALQDPLVLRRTRDAWQRGVRLVWAGGPGDLPPAALAPCFTRSLLGLSPREALECLRISLRKPLQGAKSWDPTAVVSPVQADQIYADIPSGLLADHCLDACQAWALSGWPLEEVLHGARRARGHRNPLRGAA